MRLAERAGCPFASAEFCAAVALEVGIDAQVALYRELVELQEGEE